MSDTWIDFEEGVRDLRAIKNLLNLVGLAMDRNIGTNPDDGLSLIWLAEHLSRAHKRLNRAFDDLHEEMVAAKAKPVEGEG